MSELWRVSGPGTCLLRQSEDTSAREPIFGGVHLLEDLSVLDTSAREPVFGGYYLLEDLSVLDTPAREPIFGGYHLLEDLSVLDTPAREHIGAGIHLLEDLSVLDATVRLSDCLSRQGCISPCAFLPWCSSVRGLACQENTSLRFFSPEINRSRDIRPRMVLSRNTYLAIYLSMGALLWEGVRPG